MNIECGFYFGIAIGFMLEEYGEHITTLHILIPFFVVDITRDVA